MQFTDTYEPVITYNKYFEQLKVTDNENDYIEFIEYLLSQGEELELCELYHFITFILVHAKTNEPKIYAKELLLNCEERLNIQKSVIIKYLMVTGLLKYEDIINLLF